MLWMSKADSAAQSKQGDKGSEATLMHSCKNKLFKVRGLKTRHHLTDIYISENINRIFHFEFLNQVHSIFLL